MPKAKSTPVEQDPKEKVIVEEAIVEEIPKPHIPIQKVTRFGPQSMGKFSGKGHTAMNPPSKQRPGRSAARGR